MGEGTDVSGGVRGEREAVRQAACRGRWDGCSGTEVRAGLGLAFQEGSRTSRAEVRRSMRAYVLGGQEVRLGSQLPTSALPHSTDAKAEATLAGAASHLGGGAGTVGGGPGT